MLLGDTWFPRPGSLKVTVAKAIGSKADSARDDWQMAIKLRDQARAVMLQKNGEPDLSMEDSPFYKSS